MTLERMSSRPLVVVKIGGAGADSPIGVATLARGVAQAMARGIRCVIVHGGGQQLTDLAARLGLKSSFVAGRRVTDDRLIEAAKMAFAGQVGTDLAAGLWSHGVRAASLSGVDAGLVQVHKRPPVAIPGEGGAPTLVDYGWVGDVDTVDPTVLTSLLQGTIVPLVASLGVDPQGHVFNVNADSVASAIARATGAQRLVLLSDVDGVYRDRDDPRTLFPRLTDQDLERLKAEGVVSGGMLPKLAAVSAALRNGVPSVHLVSWKDRDAVASALEGQAGLGTLFELA